MKRASTKKVKAHPACAADNDALEGNLKPVQPKSKRRARTSAAMIGLAISMGPSSLLLTRQSDRAPAAEPVGKNPTVSTVSAATDSGDVASANSVEPRAVQAESDATALVPSTLKMQLKAAAVSKPAPPAPVKHTVQKEHLEQLSEKYQSQEPPSATQAVEIAPYSSLLARLDRKPGKLLKTSSVNRIVHKLKAAKKVETLSDSYGINPRTFTQPAATAADEQLQVDAQKVTANTVKAQQRILINRLKQQSNSLKDSVAQLRSLEPSNNLSETLTKAAKPALDANVILKAQQKILINRLKQQSNSLQDSVAQSRSEKSNNLSVPAARTAEPYTASKNSPLVARESAARDLEKSQHVAAIVSSVAKSAENEASVTVTNDHNAILKAQQRILINRLKQQSNSLKDSVAQLRSLEPSNNLSEPLTKQVPASAVEMVQSSNLESQTALAAKAAEVQQQTASKNSPLVAPGDESAVIEEAEKFEETDVAAVVASSVANYAVNEPTVVVPSVAPEYQERAGNTLSSTGVGAAEGQQAAPKNSPLVAQKSAVIDSEKSKEPLATSDVVLEVPKSGVTEPTVLVPSVATNYQVKAGDTLSAIAHNHGISLSFLVKVNHLADPDQLKINQKIAIPRFQYSRPESETVAAVERPTYPKTTLPIVTFVPALSQSDRNISVSLPRLVTTSQPYVNAELIAYNPAGGIRQETLVVPPEPTVTPSLNAPYTGIGGSISDDETDQISPPTFDRSQLAQSTAAKPEAQSNPYVQNLRIDIQRLRQKYYAVPAAGKSAMPSPAINTQFGSNTPANEPINPEFRPTQAAKLLQPAIQKRFSTKDRSAVRGTTRQPVATAPLDVDGSESLQSPKRRQVSPELPPLAPVDNYLPKPFDTSTPLKGYIWPTKGVLTSGFGWRWGRMHKGIDIAAPIGTPIVASAPGVVVRAGWNSGGYGKLVDIQHPDGSLTRYAHNNRLLVQQGQEVEQGQEIAEMGTTGHSTGPHSHFEIHPPGKGAVNPIAFLPH